jgi:hypothetical protein
MSNTKGKHIVFYRLSPETVGFTFVLPTSCYTTFNRTEIFSRYRELLIIEVVLSVCSKVLFSQHVTFTCCNNVAWSHRQPRDQIQGNVW